MRSSIACIRCRRSKVKCVNSGVGTTCRTCENTGRECRYPSPILAGQKRRDSNPTRLDGGNEEGRRQRPRKSIQNAVAPPTSQQQSAPAGLNALDSNLLTPETWQKLFEVYQTHFSVDLPFIHPMTFLRPLRAAESLYLSSSTSGRDAPVIRPPGRPEFLLAFLSLTARFHPALVAHHSPPGPSRPSNPVVASEYYASAARELLAKNTNDDDQQDVEQVQTRLMLGLYEWGMCKGLSAWLTIRSAIGLAQALGLQIETDLDDKPWSLPSVVNSPGVKDEGDDVTQAEIRRRTFWSCFNMDRQLSNGKFRPQMLHIPSLRIQLPASERAFASADEVRTSMLCEETTGVPHRARLRGDRQASLRLGNSTSHSDQHPLINQRHHNTPDSRSHRDVGENEDLTSYYIKILELYSLVTKYSCAGGRRSEAQAPWDQHSTHHHLRKQLTDFSKGLHHQYVLSPRNTQAHISLKTSTPYLLVHFVRLLSELLLHREYLPFTPLQSSKPDAPLDAPFYPPTSGFNTPWYENSHQFFLRASEIVHLATVCQEWGVLPATPIVGFAIYSAALAGVYATNFPWMDSDNYMCSRRMEQGSKGKGAEVSRKALELVGSLRSRLYLENGCFKTLARVHRYYRRVKNEYKKMAASTDDIVERLRLEDDNSSNEDLVLLEKTLAHFSDQDDDDDDAQNLIDDLAGNSGDDMDDGSSALDSEKGEEGGYGDSNPSPNNLHNLHHRPSSEAAGPWNAINSNNNNNHSNHGSASAPNSGGFRSYDAAALQHSSRAESMPHAHSTPTSASASVAPQSHRSPGQPNYPHQINTFSSPAPPPPGGHHGNSSTTLPPIRTATSNHNTPSANSHDQHSAWPSAITNSETSADSKTALQMNGHRSSDPAVNANSASHTPQQQQQQQQSQSQHHPAQQHHHHQNQNQTQSQQQQQQHSSPWTPSQKKVWLDGLVTRFSADDLAAFIDGVEFGVWAKKAAKLAAASSSPSSAGAGNAGNADGAAENGAARGWLSAVWS